MRFCFSALCFALFASFAAKLQAQEITRVAVLDYAVVLKELSRQSPEQQRITELKAEIIEEMEQLKEQLTQLRDKLREAEEQKKNAQARRIQNEIDKLRDYGRKYVASKNEQITILKNKASQSNRSSDMQKILPDIISQVAREQGYSIIMNKNSQNIIWLDASIDITETIIQRLRKRLDE